MDLATEHGEHAEHVNLYGLSLTDVHEMLEFVFGNAYFAFNNRFYLQLVELFMGCKPTSGCHIYPCYV